ELVTLGTTTQLAVSARTADAPKSEAVISIPSSPSTVTCRDLPKAIVLTGSSLVDSSAEILAYNEVTWSASECTIAVTRIESDLKKGAEGTFSGTVVRDRDEVGGKRIDGPKTLTIK